MRRKEKAQKRSSIRVPWILMGLAFIFLANPNISIIDPLPDFFGYIMICAALGKVSMTCGKLEDAKRAFQKMIFVDGFKLAALVWTFGFDGTAYRGTTLMLVTFVAGVLEMLFLIPAYIKLFDGLSTLGDYIDNSSVNRHIKALKCSATDFMKRASIFFVVLKASLMIIPELASLDNDPISQFEGKVSLYPYINVMRLLSAIAVIAVGVVWAVLMIRYFRAISKDKVFNEGISEKYKINVFGRDGFFAWRDIKKGCLFFVLALLFTFDFSLEGINFIPDVISAIMLLFAVSYFARTTAISAKKLYVLTGLYGFAAVLKYAADVCYYGVNYPTNILRKISLGIISAGEAKFAVGSYISTVALCLLQSILLILACAELFMELKKVIYAHTGFVSGKEIESDMETQGRKRLWAELEKNFSRTLIAVCTFAFTDVAYSLTEAFEGYVDVDFRLVGSGIANTIKESVGKLPFLDTTIELNFGFLWVFNIAAGIILLFIALRAVDDLKYSVETKYMIEEK